MHVLFSENFRDGRGPPSIPPPAAAQNVLARSRVRWLPTAELDDHTTFRRASANGQAEVLGRNQIISRFRRNTDPASLTAFGGSYRTRLRPFAAFWLK